MKSRWILNLLLLAVVAGIALFLALRPPKEETGPVRHALSSVKAADIERVSIEFAAKSPVVLEKQSGHWRLVQPYAARADGAFVSQQLLSLLTVTSLEKFPAQDLARFGLDQPTLQLKLNDELFTFGTFNPLTSEQYVAHRGAVYLVPSMFSQYAGTQVVEMLDKRLLGPQETIAGFDFSRLEQWEKTGLKVEKDAAGTWQVSAAEAKPDQAALNAWFEEYWRHAGAQAVEPYTPDRHAQYPSFKVKLADGRVIHFDKVQEAPELLLARPDEGMLYHLQPDVGFTLLNPPVGFKPE